MPSKRSSTRPQAVTLMYPGWQVWDGEFGPVRVGEDFVASVEFVQRSPLHAVPRDREPQIEHLRDNWYQVVADVLDTSGAVVLDLGAFRVLRWVRPGETQGDFQPGTRVAFELSLSLNGWPDSPWTNRAAELYGSEHRWHVARITRFAMDSDDATEIDEATLETVDSSGQYCLLECAVVG